MRARRKLAALAVWTVVWACSAVASAQADAGYPESDAGSADVGVPEDAGEETDDDPDAGDEEDEDAEDPDAGDDPDAGERDAGERDAGERDTTRYEFPPGDNQVEGELVKPDTEGEEEALSVEDVDMDALAEEAAAEAAAESEESEEVEAEEDALVLDEESLRIDTVLISAEDLARVGGAAQRLDEEDLEALEYDDPNSVLQQVPAVFIRREDGYGLRPNIGIRGANSERSKKITLMEDGVLFAPAPYSAPAAYYFPIASRMVGLEVFKGPAAIRYGPHTVGGAVNWITRSIPGDQAGGVDLNFGSYLTGKLHAYYGKSWDHFGFLVEGVQWQSDGYKQLDGGGNTGFNKSELMAKARVNSDFAKSTYHALHVKAGYSRERSNETYLGLTDEDFEDTPNRRYAASALDQLNWNRTQGQLRYRLEVSDEFDLTATAYRHDFSRAWQKFNAFADPTPVAEILANPTGRREVFYDILRGDADTATAEEELLIGTNDRTFVSQGVQLRSNFRTIRKRWENELRFGARVHHDSVVRLHTEEPFAMEAGELVATGAPEEITTHNHGRTMAYSAYLLDEFRAWRITAAPGIRAEFVDSALTDRQADETASNFQTAFLPGLGVHFAITDDFGALAGVHRGFSPVSPGQPDDVKPELSTNYEAGVRFSRPKSRSLVEVVGFFNDYQNLLGECSFSAGCDEAQVDDQFNAGQVWIWGAESVLSHEFDAGGGFLFPARLAYTYTDSRFRAGFQSDNPQFGLVEEGDELPYVPRHQGSLRLGVRKAGFSFNVAGTYVSPMREEAGQEEDALRTDPQVLVDVLAGYDVFDGLTVYGKADNILNQRPIVSRRPLGARPARPFMAQLGVKYAF
jgi:Fe(3+) dicitrate transport protein